MKKLNEAIINIQTEMDIFAKKSGKNTMGKGYDYFTETDLYNALKPLMKKNGIGYTIEAIEEPHFTPIGNMVSFWSKGKLTLFKEDEIKELSIVLAATNTDPAKAIGSALTYGARYWLCKEFGIATNELDPDNDENTKNVNNKGQFKKLIQAVEVVQQENKNNKASKLQQLKHLQATVENGTQKLKELLGIDEHENIKVSAITSLSEEELDILIERMEF